MLGWKLFMRAVTLLLDNLGEALRVSAVPYAVVIAISVWVTGAYPDAVSGTAVTPETALSVEGAGAVLIMVIVNLVVSLWIAVAWHRYVLLEERPAGWLPPLNGSAMLGYLWLSVLIGLLVAVIMFAIMIPLGIILLAVPFLAGVIPAAALFIGMILFYRLAIVLPARAVERPMTFGEAIEATRGHSGTVVVLALLTVGFSLALQIPTMLDGGTGIISAIYQGVVGWIGLMLGVSTLTSLYGHLVEGRPVD